MVCELYLNQAVIFKRTAGWAFLPNFNSFSPQFLKQCLAITHEFINSEAEWKSKFPSVGKPL